MTTICPQPETIFTTPQGKLEWLGQSGYSIDAEERKPPLRWLRFLVEVITAVPELRAEDHRAQRRYSSSAITVIPEATAERNAWIEAILPVLDGIAEMPNDWDSEGSPRPDAQVIAAAKRLLDRLHNSRLGTIPVPFVCPVPGGGIQLEWTSTERHLEIEFLDASTIAFLKEEATSEGEASEAGEYPATDAESTRQLLEWFAAV